MCAAYLESDQNGRQVDRSLEIRRGGCSFAEATEARPEELAGVSKSQDALLLIYLASSAELYSY